MVSEAPSRECRQTPELLEERREKVLSPALGRRLDAHLAHCRFCRLEEAASAPLPVFRSLASGPLPAGVENYILGGLRATGSRPSRSRFSPFRWVRRWEPVPMAASLILAGVLLLVWALRGGTGPPVPAGPASFDSLPAHAMTNGIVALEDIRSSTAEVFTFSLQDETGPTEVILIVDQSIEL